jgi:hypothetical protein
MYLVPSAARFGSIVLGFIQISRFSHGHNAHLTLLLLLAHQAITFHNILGKQILAKVFLGCCEGICFEG